MSTKRKAISKRLRFEVFKRDSFKCQYCGHAAPDVLLRVDHIDPVAKGGATELLNLITACFDCNAGKSDVALSDNAAISKQREQLDELNLRREQMEMMVAWRKELARLDDDKAEAVADSWSKAVNGSFVNERGMITIRKLIRKFGLSEVLSAVQIVSTEYIETSEDGKATLESAQLAFSKIGGVCRLSAMGEEGRRLYYIRGICKRRFDYCVPWECLQLLTRAHDLGAGVAYLESLAKDARSWSIWKRWMHEVIEENTADLELPGWRNDPDLATKRAARVGVSPQVGESLETFVARIEYAMNHSGL